MAKIFVIFVYVIHENHENLELYAVATCKEKC